jgi:hypothetical protein
MSLGAAYRQSFIEIDDIKCATVVVALVQWLLGVNSIENTKNRNVKALLIHLDPLTLYFYVIDLCLNGIVVICDLFFTPIFFLSIESIHIPERNQLASN